MSDIIRPQPGRAAILDGKAAAAAIDRAAAEAARALTPRLGRPPCLAVVLVGEDPASQVYVRNKARRTEAAGMTSVEHRRPADFPQEDLIALVGELNADDGVDGILVQLPLPRTWTD
jgi:methylenetetrahydrofolate dehydrogenase (NADP+) / methenyltetrahydrofolate cyclohydrolase